LERCTVKLSDKAKAVISTVAPTLGTALAGPVGGAVGVILQQVFGTSDNKTLEAAIAGANPEALLKLKQAENEFLVKMKELGITEDKLVYDDLASARSTYAAVRDPLVAWIGGGTVVGFFVLVFVVVSGEVKIDSAILGALIGYVSAKADQVLSFYFGSSKGSKEKTDALVNALRKK
jgi:hypothetical protein